MSNNLSALPLFSWNEKKDQPSAPFSGVIKLFCWNIGNPSLERSQKQAIWLQEQKNDIYVLTECKNSKGCNYLEDYFRENDYNVHFIKPQDNEFGVMICSKFLLEPSSFSNQISFINSRVASVFIQIPDLDYKIELIGVYVPSRDASVEKTEKKKGFATSLVNAFRSVGSSQYRIFCGDFNVLEPNHYPRYSFFQAWEYRFYEILNTFNLRDAYRHFHPTEREYSWVGHTGDGYRYDHIFMSDTLVNLTRACFYLHSARSQKLSDHSAILAEITLE